MMKAQARRFVTAWTVTLALFLMVGLTYGDERPPTHVYIQVKSLGCPFCVKGLEMRLKKLDAVEGASTSLKKGEIVLHLKAGQTVDEKELREAVMKAGFNAGKIRFEKKPASPTSKKETS